MKTIFTVFKNQMFGTERRRSSFSELLDMMTKKEKEFWSEVKFKDFDGNTICIQRCHLDDGMTFDEIVEDWIEFGDLDESIHSC